MGFLLTCNNKGCGKTNEPLLDRETNQVFCTDCGNEIKSVSPFIKNAMVGLNQFKRKTGTQEAFSLDCQKCHKIKQPKIKNNKLYCPACEEEHTNVSPTYAHAIKQFIGQGTFKRKE